MRILRTCHSALGFVVLVSLASAGQSPHGMPEAAARAGSQAGSNRGNVTCDASGVVVNATTGDPVRRAQIRLRYQQGTNAISTITDADGRYLFSGVQPGQYQMAVRKKGYLDASFGMAVCPVAERRADELSQRVSNITPLRLAPLSAISGRVTDDGGEPVLGAVVHASRVNGIEGKMRTVATAYTDDLGMYRLYGLRPGRYYVSAGPPDESSGGPESTTGDSDEDYLASYYPQGTEPGAASAVSVGIANSASGIDIQLIRAVPEKLPFVLVSASSSSVSNATTASDQTSVALSAAKAGIAGTIVNATTSEPVRRAKVTLEPTRNGSASYGAQTDAMGHFEIKDIDAGAYRAVIEHAGYLPTPHVSGVPNEIPVSLTLKPKERLRDVVLRATPSSVLTGRVFDQDGDPAQAFQVQALRYSFVNGKRQLQSAGSSITNDLGEYRLYGLSPGQFYVSAASMNESQNGPEGPERYVGTYYPQALDIEGAAPIVVHEGEQVPGINIWAKLSRLVELRGRVMSPSGGLKAGSTVITITRASPDAAELSFNATRGTDTEGHFQFAGIPPGTYALAAVYNDEGGQLAAAETLEVRSTNLDNIDLALNRGLVVSGRIQSEGVTASNLKSLRVMLQPDTIMPTGTVEADVRPDGTFSVAGVLPDQYTVEVFGLPDEYYVKSVHAGAQESSRGKIDFRQPVGPLSIVVRLGATISGSVVGDDGQPAVGTDVVVVPMSQQSDEGQAYKTVASDREGKFRFVGIAPGTYQVFAITGVDPDSYMNPDFIASVQSFAASVTVQDNSAPQSELRIEVTSLTE